MKFGDSSWKRRKLPELRDIGILKMRKKVGLVML